MGQIRHQNIPIPHLTSPMKGEEHDLLKISTNQELLSFCAFCGQFFVCGFVGKNQTGQRWT
jgi:hypothetical protein